MEPKSVLGIVLILELAGVFGLYISPVNNQPAVYEIKEDENTHSLIITNPEPGKPVLREIIYYHVIEKPYEQLNEHISDNIQATHKDDIGNKKTIDTGNITLVSDFVTTDNESNIDSTYKTDNVTNTTDNINLIKEGNEIENEIIEAEYKINKNTPDNNNPIAREKNAEYTEVLGNADKLPSPEETNKDVIEISKSVENVETNVNSNDSINHGHAIDNNSMVVNNSTSAHETLVTDQEITKSKEANNLEKKYLIDNKIEKLFFNTENVAAAIKINEENLENKTTEPFVIIVKDYDNNNSLADEEHNIIDNKDDDIKLDKDNKKVKEYHVIIRNGSENFKVQNDVISNDKKTNVENDDDNSNDEEKVGFNDRQMFTNGHGFQYFYPDPENKVDIEESTSVSAINGLKRIKRDGSETFEPENYLDKDQELSNSDKERKKRDLFSTLSINEEYAPEDLLKNVINKVSERMRRSLEGTYGMSLVGDQGVVWNDLYENKIYNEVGEMAEDKKIAKKSSNNDKAINEKIKEFHNFITEVVPSSNTKNDESTPIKPNTDKTVIESTTKQPMTKQPTPVEPNTDQTVTIKPTTVQPITEPTYTESTKTESVSTEKPIPKTPSTESSKAYTSTTSQSVTKTPKLDEQRFEEPKNEERNNLDKTYGMSLTGNQGIVWNDLNGRRVSYHVGDVDEGTLKTTKNDEIINEKIDKFQESLKETTSDEGSIGRPSIHPNIEEATTKLPIIEPLTDEPLIYKPVTEAPKTKVPTTEPLNEKPINTKPITERPNTEPLAIKKPTAYEPTEEPKTNRPIIVNSATGEPTKTYGMILTGDQGIVWNDLHGDRISYDIGKLDAESEVNHYNEINKPDLQNTPKPIDDGKFTPGEDQSNKNDESKVDHYNEVNKPDLQSTPKPIDDSKLTSGEDESNKNDGDVESEVDHYNEVNKPDLQSTPKPIDDSKLTSGEDESNKNDGDVESEVDHYNEVNKPDLQSTPKPIEDSKLTSGEDESNKNDGDVESEVDHHNEVNKPDLQNTPKPIIDNDILTSGEDQSNNIDGGQGDNDTDKFSEQNGEHKNEASKTIEDKINDVVNEAFDNEIAKFKDTLKDWISEEITKQLEEYMVSNKLTKPSNNTTDSETKIDGTKEENLGETEAKKRKDCDDKKEKDGSPINMTATNIYGNTVGNGNVTNIFMFNINNGSLIDNIEAVSNATDEISGNENKQPETEEAKEAEHGSTLTEKPNAENITNNFSNENITTEVSTEKVTEKPYDENVTDKFTKESEVTEIVTEKLTENPGVESNIGQDSSEFSIKNTQQIDNEEKENSETLNESIEIPEENETKDKTSTEQITMDQKLSQTSETPNSISDISKESNEISEESNVSEELKSNEQNNSSYESSTISEELNGIPQDKSDSLEDSNNISEELNGIPSKELSNSSEEDSNDISEELDVIPEEPNEKLEQIGTTEDKIDDLDDTEFEIDVRNNFEE